MKRVEESRGWRSAEGGEVQRVRSAEGEKVQRIDESRG